jgi:hypothetical protein
MELLELKKIWQEENQKLEKRIALNEERLRRMDMDKIVSEFDKILKVSIFGRNAAFVYFLISLSMSLYAFKDWAYSMPCLLGGLAMLWSFIDHLVIKKPNYLQLSILELQKSIAQFRIHTARTAKYDTAIVLFWFLTITPLFLKMRFGLLIFSDMPHFARYGLMALCFFAALVTFSKAIYKKIDQQLRQAEMRLDEIEGFERVSE